MKHQDNRELRGDESEVMTDETQNLTPEKELDVESLQPDTELEMQTNSVISEADTEMASDEESPKPVSGIENDAIAEEDDISEDTAMFDINDEPVVSARPVKKESRKREAEREKGRPRFMEFRSDEPQPSGRINPVPDSIAYRPGALLILRLIVSLVLILLPRFLDISDNVIMILYVASAVVAGYDIAIAAVRDIFEKVYLRENLPVLIAVICAFAIDRPIEGAIAVILLQLAYILRGVLICNTKDSLLNSISIPAPYKGISVGDSIMVNEGTRVPTDCTVTDGRGMVDCGFITGDISPVQFKTGDFIPAGAVCLSGQMMLRAETLPEASIAAKLCRTVDGGYKNITETEKSIISASRYVTPVLLLVSLVLLILLPFSYDYPFAESLRRVITIIAISSPCAALLSVPMSYLEALISARRSGIVFRDATMMDRTANVGAVVFDKVGTVTNDSYVVTDIYSDKMDPSTFLKVAAHVAAVSTRPLERAIVAAFGDYIDFNLVKDFVEYRGKGVSVTFNGIKVLLGSHTFIVENGIDLPRENFDGTTVYMTVQGEYAGRIVLKDSINPNISETIRELHSAGVDRVAMLSSDSRERDSAVAREAGINEYYAECSPEDKARRLKDVRSRIPKDKALAYVSSGESCPQACRTADIAVVTRGMENRYSGGDSDIVVMGRAVKSVPEAVLRASKVRKTASIKFFAAIFVKVLLTVLAAAGFIPLWFGILMDNCFAMALIVDYTAMFRPKGRTGGNE